MTEMLPNDVKKICISVIIISPYITDLSINIDQGNWWQIHTNASQLQYTIEDY